MDSGTALGPQAFPSTLWSEIIALQGNPNDRRERLEKLILRYWRPVYWAVKSFSGVQPEEAPDLTQEFFVRILEGEILPGVDPERGSFRHYLRGALRNFLLKDFRRGNTQKRGGGRRLLSLDFDRAGSEPAAEGGDPVEVMDRVWARQLLNEALADLEAELKAEGRAADFEIFRSYDLAGGGESPSYADLAAKHGVQELDVWRVLRSCRQRLRGLVMNRIGPYVRDGGDLIREFQELFRF